MRTASGMTVLEVVVVLLILGILAAIALAALGTFGEQVEELSLRAIEPGWLPVPQRTPTATS